jgi:hypothetical protein
MQLIRLVKKFLKKIVTFLQFAVIIALILCPCSFKQFKINIPKGKR